MAGRGGGGGGWRGGRGGGGGGGFGRGRSGLDMPDDLEVQYKETPLFPDYQPNPFTEMSKDEERLMEGWKLFMDTCKDLPYYIDVAPPKQDIERYSDRFKKPQKAGRKTFATVPTDLSFFPDELHSVKDASKAPRAAKLVKKDIDLSKLDALEKEEGAGGKVQAAGEDDDDDELPAEEIDEDLEEDDNDYIIDHYDDEYDDLDGGGGSGQEDYS
ncbi:DNA-directed RNA polymerase III, subunit Rpc31 [Fimicolochytrium jonesii]|uniref:DNA-directed RNA polymerase III, subunit Rpc31 n=1 Tax=Fimicolochytrium jonesii TaxID=1396493 RepID=UPI0022FEC4EF|nr:DNA-directed RNA polymerase III, subunit Rpc31 [Fimicolochytrium jonesii]KAI8821772.1 DNA-directed RNA polymerase III, subunit Rpc31 [Fimicolochytrium jonesii]